ncbi:MAG: anti-sigma factor family protein [Gemmatimonadota bacterium]
MPHITEGLLHAHLDGALGPDEQLQWADAEAHLEVCDDCRRRLEEAAELRDAARELLAGATPSRSATRPAFDELVSRARVRRAGTSSGRTPDRAVGSWWRKPAALGWAASLVIAAGAGWIGRQLVVERGLEAPGVAVERDAPAGRVGPDAAARLERFRDDDALDEARARGDAAATPAAPHEKAKTRENAPGAAEESRADGDATAAPESRMQEVVPLGAAARAAAPRCYAAAVPPEADGGGEAAMAGRLETLRLAADGTAGLRAGGRSLVGFWERAEADTLRLRVTDGDEWRELALIETDEGLRGGDAELEIVACP